MYIPKHFEQQDTAALHQLIHNYPLATLIVSTSNGICVNHVPLIVDDDQSGKLRLHGHIARANPLCDVTPAGDVMAVFQGPNAYISPAWYPTKQQHGKVVPTWNYMAVHASGELRLIDDRSWTLKMVERLTDREESDLPDPWAVSDAPDSFVEGLLNSIVGLELTVTDLRGKWKVSQNQSEENQTGVRAGLQSVSNPAADLLSGFQS